MSPKHYYKLVDLLKTIRDDGGDPRQLTTQALRQLDKRVYSYDRRDEPEDIVTEVKVAGKDNGLFERVLR